MDRLSNSWCTVMDVPALARAGVLKLRSPAVSLQETSARLTGDPWPGGPGPAADMGARLRRIRHSRRRTLRDVAGAARVSESFLSQLERGLVSASVASLQRIAQALGIEIQELFASRPDASPRVTRMAQSEALAFGDRARKWLMTPSPMYALEVVLCEFDEEGSTGEDPCAGGDSEELCIVLEGRVELDVDGERNVLGAGDTARYRSAQPHGTRNLGPGRARVLYALTPPTS
jgi:transcriptional regulator with XRE-family HTH domain